MNDKAKYWTQYNVLLRAPEKGLNKRVHNLVKWLLENDPRFKGIDIEGAFPDTYKISKGGLTRMKLKGIHLEYTGVGNTLAASRKDCCTFDTIYMLLKDKFKRRCSWGSLRALWTSKGFNPDEPCSAEDLSVILKSFTKLTVRFYDAMGYEFKSLRKLAKSVKASLVFVIANEHLYGWHYDDLFRAPGADSLKLTDIDIMTTYDKNNYDTGKDDYDFQGDFINKTLPFPTSINNIIRQYYPDIVIPKYMLIDNYGRPDIYLREDRH